MKVLENYCNKTYVIKFNVSYSLTFDVILCITYKDTIKFVVKIL